jgi:uncharacterized protein YqeY
VLCSNDSNIETVCGDVNALVRHVWMDHGANELKHEEDIVEVVTDVRKRRDSLMSFTESRRSSDRRSASVGPRGGRSRRRWVGDADPDF